MVARDPEKGTVVIFVALVLPIILGFLCFAIDFGHYYAIRTQLQAATDATAMAGVQQLNGTTGGILPASQKALSFGPTNSTDLGALGMNSSDVQVGNWSPTTKLFSPIGSTIMIGDGLVNITQWTPQYINAVRVSVRADGVGNHNPTQKISFPVTSLKELKPVATSVAVEGGSCEQAGCVLPIVVPSCGLTDNTGATICGTTTTMYFNHGQGRDIVLANVVDPSGNVNNSTERGQATEGAACKLPAVEAGGQVQLGNGNDFNKQIADALESPIDVRCGTCGPDYAGCTRYTLEVANNGNCALPMNKASTIIGFVSVVITDINPSGADAGITVYVDCNTNPKPSRAGCANFGVGAGHGSMGL